MSDNKDKAFEDFWGISPDKVRALLKKDVAEPIEDVTAKVRTARQKIAKINLKNE